MTVVDGSHRGVRNPPGEYDADIPILETIDRIEAVNLSLERFGAACMNFMPLAAVDFLGWARLEWQVSLSRSLRHWIAEPANAIPHGDLILAWANLGSLIEGTIKTFLCVYYDSFKVELDDLLDAHAWPRKDVLLDPARLKLDALLRYRAVQEIFLETELDLFRLVERRRDAIHRHHPRQIGSGEEFQAAVRAYLFMLRSCIRRLPPTD